jgi:Immunoglobulin-like domain of bacterial spore germination/Sporulation and spore germination
MSGSPGSGPPRAALGGVDPGSGPTSGGPTSSASPAPTGPGLGAARPAPKLPANQATPVYVLGGTAVGPRLYREFRPSTTGDRVQAALAGLAVAPVDPDYRSAWLGATARVSRAGSSATVTFGRAPALAGAPTAMAVQQVVYTVTAADPAIRTVRVVAPRLPAAGPTGRADQGGVLAPVWLLDPVDGGTAGSRLTVSGTASVFEATVAVEIRRGSAVLARTTATASTGAPGRGNWQATLSVPPGDYVVAASEMSERDGSAVATDTKRITVR